MRNEYPVSSKNHPECSILGIFFEGNETQVRMEWTPDPALYEFNINFTSKISIIDSDFE